MVTRREEALGAVKLYPGEPYVGDASPSLQWTGSDAQFVDSDLLVLFRNVASLVPVAGPILAPALAYVKDIVICVKTVKDNRRQAEALATDVLSHAQELLQTAKDADIRLLPGTPVANIVTRIEVMLEAILQNIRICQEPSSNKVTKALKQMVKRDDIAVILFDGRQLVTLFMAALIDEPLLPIAVASQSQSQLNASKHLPDFKQKAKEEAALPFRILEAELEHHGTVGAAHAPDPNTRDKVAADVAILHLLQQRARKLNPEMATSNDDDSVRTTALKLNRKVIESQQTGEDAQDRFESTKRLFALGTCLLQLAMYDQALPVWKLAAIDCRKLSDIPAELQLLLGLVLLALSQSYYMVSRLDEALDAAKECVDTLGKADVADEAVAASLDTARDFQNTLEQASNDGQSILSTSLFPSNDAAQGILVPPSALFSGRRMVAAVAEETQTREAEEAEKKRASKGHSDTQSNLKTKGALEKYKALSEHAVYLSKSGQPGDAARAVQIGESVAESYRKLCVEDTSRWRSNYAEALSDHAGYLLEWAERCDSATAAQVREKRVGVYERLHGLDASRWRPDYAKALSEHTEYLSKSHQLGGFARAVLVSQRRVELFKEDVVQWKTLYDDAQESHTRYLRIFEELKSPYPAIRYILSPVSISFKHLVVTLKRTNEQTRQLAEELEQIIRKVIVDLVANVEVSDNVHSVDSEFNIIAQKLDSDLVRVLKDISPGSQRWRFLAPWKRTENILAQAKKEFAFLYLNPCARPSVPRHVQPTLDLNRFSHYPDLGDLLKACNSSIPFVAATIRPVLVSLDGILISVQDSENDNRWQAAGLAIKILERVTEFVDLFKGDDFMRSPDFALVEAMRKLGDDLFELRSDMCTRQRASGHWWRIFIARKSVESLLVSGHKAFMANTKQAEMDVLYERYAGQPRPTRMMPAQTLRP
ncbi:unnamed protein product [Tilletia laevis]|uniref:Uncharacterized protein n=2 Tax=Tilletia TaxID=13289 RepID=A0A8X7MUA8_9BASI|nr:hypothetical protein CF336_g1873 [Tilletia laevis]KAE8248729.1 hypothetical protein A4X06_0g3552 [Tilletia controversa]KAE8263270.1 hypothetical protein A4X03_0g1808 [Tilletia caries]KAE8204258.1 hypothetical protein CF335_g2721 [Tilletia laevis]CAD6893882.1 unnamed protein product [Tilletia caries]